MKTEKAVRHLFTTAMSGAWSPGPGPTPVVAAPTTAIIERSVVARTPLGLVTLATIDGEEDASASPGRAGRGVAEADTGASDTAGAEALAELATAPAAAAAATPATWVGEGATMAPAAACAFPAEIASGPCSLAPETTPAPRTAAAAAGREPAIGASATANFTLPGGAFAAALAAGRAGSSRSGGSPPPTVPLPKPPSTPGRGPAARDGLDCGGGGGLGAGDATDCRQDPNPGPSNPARARLQPGAAASAAAPLPASASGGVHPAATALGSRLSCGTAPIRFWRTDGDRGSSRRAGPSPVSEAGCSHVEGGQRF